MHWEESLIIAGAWRAVWMPGKVERSAGGFAFALCQPAVGKGELSAGGFGFELCSPTAGEGEV